MIASTSPTTILGDDESCVGCFRDVREGEREREKELGLRLLGTQGA